MRSLPGIWSAKGFIIAVITSETILSISCGSSSVKHQQELVARGKELANTYCQSCHALPDPGMATRRIWVENILPNMGPRLGIFRFLESNYPSLRNAPFVPRSFYPAKPVISQEDWAAILNYYNYAAPDSLTGQDRSAPIRPFNRQFEAQMPVLHPADPVSTFVSIDSTSGKIMQADGLRGYLYAYNQKMELTDSIPTGGMVVDLIRLDGLDLFCDIGVINPNDGKSGKIRILKHSPPGKSAENLPSLLIDSLRRPVQMIACDLNGDGRKDLIVCEFGNLMGSFSWFENMPDNRYQRHTLRESPGAIHAEVMDYDHDGLPDIWVLFAQGDEKLTLFRNLGHGQFEAKDLLRFPPIFGSTYFSLADFNGDGYPDILYTAGDNADFSQILKPYHGIYILLNDGDLHFTKQYFYPMHGCYKALARDFDGDGDLDIAAISYFADYANQPEEGFVYLENKGNWDFEASSLPEARLGRWLTMDAGDLDGDGRPDLVLGNFSVGPTPIRPKTDWKKGPSFLYLKNIGQAANAPMAKK